MTSTLAWSLHHLGAEQGEGGWVMHHSSQKKVEQQNSTNGFRSPSYRDSALLTAYSSQKANVSLSKFLPQKLRPPWETLIKARALGFSSMLLKAVWCRVKPQDRTLGRPLTCKLWHWQCWPQSSGDPDSQSLGCLGTFCITFHKGHWISFYRYFLSTRHCSRARNKTENPWPQGAYLLEEIQWSLIFFTNLHHTLQCWCVGATWLVSMDDNLASSPQCSSFLTIVTYAIVYVE